MGDWCGSGPLQAGPRTDKKEVTGAEQWAKRCCAVVGSKVQAKKRSIFFNGEVFFLLTRPLMGDPFTTVR